MVSPDLKTLSAKHASSISTIIEQLFSAFDAHSILITGLTPESIKVNYANGTAETYLLHSTKTIPFSPPLSSLADAGARLDQMAAESRLKPKHGRSSIVIAEYRIPKGEGSYYAKLTAWGILSVVVWPLVRTVFMEGNIFADILGLFRGDWVYGIPAFLSLGTLVMHIVGSSVVLVPKLYKYNVPFGSPLWWKWYMGHIVGGMSSPWTFDEMVAEEMKRRKAEMKKSL